MTDAIVKSGRWMVDCLGLINTLAAWLFVGYALYLPGTHHWAITCGISVCIIVFLCERGFNHLDFKASVASGIAIIAKDDDDDTPSTAVVTTTVETK